MVLSFCLVREGENIMKLSVGYITSREQCEIDWLLDSLLPQVQSDDEIEVLMIDGLSKYSFRSDFTRYSLVPAKPNIFSGKYRLTKENWWSKSSSINTFLCVAKYPNILLLDDRCVVMPRFLETIKTNQGIILAGAYEKRQHMTVEKGVIKNGGIIQAVDGRQAYVESNKIPIPFHCGGEWLFGCCLSLPLEFALAINGWPERCDSLSFEDVIAGLLFKNNNFPMKFDPRAKMVEDRTPEKLGTPMRRESKERHPNDTSDKAHTTLRWVATATLSDNDYDIKELRAKIQAGGEFPLPDPNKTYVDWFDGQLIRDFR